MLKESLEHVKQAINSVDGAYVAISRQLAVLTELRAKLVKLMTDIEASQLGGDAGEKQ